jgi:hypothetical protein
MHPRPAADAKQHVGGPRRSAWCEGAAARGASRPALGAQDVREKGSKAHFVGQVAAVARAVADSAAAGGGGAQPALPPGCVEYILAGTFHVRRRARPRYPAPWPARGCSA